MRILYISLILLSSAKALCGTYTLPIADLNSRGWFSNTGVRMTNAQGNYLVGSPGGTAEYRNFFIFDLSAIPSTETITSASLVIYNTPYSEYGIGGYNSFDASELYQLFSVDYTTASTLRSDSSSLVSAFDDLGDGIALSSGLQFTPSSQNAETTITLNLDFITIAQSSIGKEIIIGGRITSLTLGDSNGETLFSASHGLSLESTRLIVTTAAIPETSSASIIVGLASIAYVAQRRRLTSGYRQRGLSSP